MKAIFCFAVLANIIARVFSFSLSNIDLDTTALNTSTILKVSKKRHPFDLFNDLGVDISLAGDINADGIDDFIVASNVEQYNGRVYVIYGRTGGIPQDIDLNNLDLTKGFYISGITNGYLGTSVSSAGDVNGDGVEDVIVGAFIANHEVGAAFIIYGRAGGVQSHVNPEKTLDLSQGLEIHGGNQSDWLGFSVNSAGDVNGDGVDDVIIGGKAAYVIYGKIGGFESHIDLKNPLSLTQGFQIIGAVGDSIISVNAAGDVNKDGVDDIIVGACRASPSSTADAGAAYVIYGRVDGFQANIDLTTPLSLTEGFKINVGSADDYFANFVSSAGDVNGDGVDDVVISAPVLNLASNSSKEKGTVYIIYGKRGSQTNIDLSTGTLDLTRGFQINNGITGPAKIRSIGDLNGDGAADIIIGAQATVNEKGVGGILKAHVIYGRIGGAEAHLDLDTPMNLSQGFDISKVWNERLGRLAVGSGDFNNDGLTDILIGAYQIESFYVLYGECTLANCSRCAAPEICQKCQYDSFLSDGKCYYSDTICSIFYAPNGMTTDCKNLNNTCMPNYFEYQNGSCLPTCSDPYSGDLRYGSAFCLAPCDTNKYLYPNGTCLATCVSDSLVRQENNVKYCDHSEIIDILNNKNTAQPNPPNMLTRSETTTSQVQSSASSNNGAIIKLGVTLGVLVAIIVGYVVYRKKKTAGEYSSVPALNQEQSGIEL